MAFGPTDLKKGQVFQLDNIPYRVVEYGQKVMGRGGSIVNVKIKSLLNGKVLDKTFKGNESIEPADVTNKNVQYLYSDANSFFFMDEQTYEQFELPVTDMLDQTGYLKEGDRVLVQLFNDRVINIELPKNVPLKVTYAETAVKGDTSSAITKDATVETGIIVKVPAFVKVGDIISVDTATGTYRERVK
ncbi:elongation factor P [Candidatus Saccharibacteria bacterium]|nr:elongation factor P [Candidatus Saccharibacteria bacterium]MBI3337821.1 elongation factor P [Candidatus Saccharibacteria bacterium]